jgi:hypothetical protein
MVDVEGFPSPRSSKRFTVYSCDSKEKEEL